METKLVMNTLIVEDKNVAEPPKKIKKSKPKKIYEIFFLWKDTHLQNIIHENVKKLFIMILDD